MSTQVALCAWFGRGAGASCALVLFVSSLVACEPGGVGDPCLPDAEYSASFLPFAIEEIYLESRSFQCETRVCLVNHFQGRVSCPLGQNDSTSEPGCTVPGSGATEAARVEGPVPAWDLDRPPSRAVYCSCRCDGPDDNARYCECPSGYTCTELVRELGLPGGQLAGSYCVRDGTEYDPTNPPSLNTCSATAENCE